MSISGSILTYTTKVGMQTVCAHCKLESPTDGRTYEAYLPIEFAYDTQEFILFFVLGAVALMLFPMFLPFTFIFLFTGFLAFVLIAIIGLVLFVIGLPLVSFIAVVLAPGALIGYLILAALGLVEFGGKVN